MDEQRPILVVEDDEATRAFLLENFAAAVGPCSVFWLFMRKALPVGRARFAHGLESG
jgi:hypothetical protein